LKDLDALEKSLPLAQKLYPLEEKLRELNDEKKQSGKVMYEALDVLKKDKEEYKETIEKLDEINNKN